MRLFNLIEKLTVQSISCSQSSNGTAKSKSWKSFSFAYLVKKNTNINYICYMHAYYITSVENSKHKLNCWILVLVQVDSAGILVTFTDKMIQFNKNVFVNV